MSRRGPRLRLGRRPVARPETLAGWVFADLLLVLMLVGLGAAITQAKPPEEPRKQKPETVVVGMEQEPVNKQFRVRHSALLGGPGKSAAVQQARREIKKQTSPLKGRRAAMVFVWAGGDNPARAIPVARAVKDQLVASDPELFRGAVLRPYWAGNMDLGEARLELFLFQERRVKQ